MTWRGATLGLTNLKGVLHTYGSSNLMGESYGKGTPRVLWLHGWARRGSDFSRAAHVLAEHGVASIALDLPGFGASPPPPAGGGARLYGDLIESATREIAREPLVLVGHSFGGRVATVVASRHADLVRALVLSGTPLLRSALPTKPVWTYRSIRWLHERGVLSDARLEVARQKYGSTDYRHAQGVMREVVVASVNEGYESELERLRVPVTFVWGENDQVVPLDVATRAAAMLHVEHSMSVLEGVGHLVPLEAPEQLARAVREALDS